MSDVQSAEAPSVGFQPLVELAKSVVDLTPAGEARDKALELYGQVVSAHGTHLALLQQVRRLEENAGEKDEWVRQRQRYKLVDFGGGVFVYVLKEDEAEGEPPHYLCAKCYEHKTRSILRRDSALYTERAVWDCPECHERFAAGGHSLSGLGREPYDPLG